MIPTSFSPHITERLEQHKLEQQLRENNSQLFPSLGIWSVFIHHITADLRVACWYLPHKELLRSDHLLITQLNALLNLDSIIKTDERRGSVAAQRCLRPPSVTALLLTSIVWASSSRDVYSSGKLCWLAHISDATQTSCGLTGSDVL